jgi:prepilin-type processing-associated H-X9-DG protein
MTANYRAVAGRSDGMNYFEYINEPANRVDSARNLPFNWRGPMHIVLQAQGFGVESLGNIIDGTSNTLLVGEYATITAPRRRVLWAYSFAGYSVGTAIPDSRTLIPDFDRCANTLGAGANACSRGFGSFHANGQVINFVMADGSVRAISTGIQVDLFASLGSIAGGEYILGAND